MNEHKLTELLRLQSSEVPGRTRFCPDGEVITAYFEGSLDQQARTGLKRHLVDCRFCLAQLGNLERLAAVNDGESVPGSLLAEAKHLAKPPAPARTRFSAAWAVAAVLVLAVSTVILLGSRPEPPPEVRSIDPAPLRPSILSPVDGDSIESSELLIRWTEVTDSLHYEVRVVNAEGFIVWQDRVEDTELQPPVRELLKPGMSYYVRVDAYLAETNNVSSEHVLFTVLEREP